MVQINFLPKGGKKVNRETKIAFVFLIIFAVLFGPIASVTAAVAEGSAFPAPTLIAPADGSFTSQTKPIVTGLALNDSLIKVFIDDELNGQFMVKNDPSGTANFGYEPFLNLRPGWHKVLTTATDAKGQVSISSNTLNFFVEYPMSAPTLFQPVVNEQTKATQPWFVGLAINDSLVKIYIDGILNGQFMVKNHPSGAASFSYQTYYEMTPGRHTVFALAEDPNGKASQPSAIIEFVIPQNPAPEAVSEKTTEVKGEETDKTDGQETQKTPVTNSEEKTDDTNSENSTAAKTDEDEDSNWLLVVGLMILAVGLILLIDNLVRRPRQNPAPDPFKPPAENKEPPPELKKTEVKEDHTDQLFPPPPPDMK
ncbi:MAG: hypothetical protein PHI73_01335 [Patescibacteria group bacterium]|nr:hypothetical protein [Patescibacteria group bacterium]